MTIDFRPVQLAGVVEALGNPYTKVGFGATREVGQCADAAERVHHRRVHSFVPRNYLFLVRYLPLLFDPQEVAVDSDVIEKDLVLAELGEQDLLFGPEAVEPCLIEERDVQEARLSANMAQNRIYEVLSWDTGIRHPEPRTDGGPARG